MRSLAVTLLLCCAGFLVAVEHLELGTPFSHHAVLQRDEPLPIWGWAPPGQVVSVVLGEVEAQATADDQGRWRVVLDPQPAGGPHRLRVTGSERSVVVNDVLIGEVWLCAGQSNMEWPVVATDHHEAEEQAAGEGPAIRFLQLPNHPAPDPVELVRADWRRASPQAIRGWSAVAWGFARHLHAELGVPIGIVQADWGGTRIESWIPASGGDEDPAFAAAVATDEAGPRQQLRLAGANTEVMRRWRAGITADGQRIVDPGRQPRAWNWEHDQLPEAGWGRTTLPGNWENEGLALDGAVWYRRTVDIPERWADEHLILELGPIDDHDQTWFAGHLIGATGPEIDASWAQPRRYRIPKHRVTPGEHVIAVRVWDDWGSGGFAGTEADLRLYPKKRPDQAIALGGPWRYRVELALPEDRFDLDRAHQQTTVLFNGMIAPIMPMAMRGVCWYQGESDAGSPDRYAELLPLLVRSWRRAAERPLPMLVVQLPRFGQDRADPARWSWALIREAQAEVLELPKTSLVVTIDTGEADDLHPRDKRVVARRLAQAALRDVYALPGAPTPPRAVDVVHEEGALRVRITGAEGLTTTDGEPPRAFFIAGQDRRWHAARARIEGTEVVVSHPRIAKPVAVRYAWTAFPDVNLVDAEGLPLAPFRSDRW